MKTVLITGGTGAIGSVLARYFLDDPQTRVRLLIRAQSAGHLSERVDELRRFWAVHSPGHSGSDDGTRLKAVAGDVTRENLGLDASTYDRLAKEVTHCIHSAGDVKLNRPLDDARRSAVDSVRHVISFCETARQRGAFEKIEIVSTVGVAGNTPGVVQERDLTQPRAFRNSYEAAKAEAETLVLRKIDEGLPATIHRPSMVIGDSKTGVIIKFQVFYHLCEFLSGRRTGGVIPDARGITLDVIPVDYVARAIQLASGRPDTVGRIFHLCSGPSDAPQIPELAHRVHALFASYGIPVPRVRSISPTFIRAALPLARWVTAGKLRRALESLPYFLAYLDAPQTFANTRSGMFFSAAGLAQPNVETTLGAVLSYYLSRQYPIAGSSTFAPTTAVA